MEIIDLLQLVHNSKASDLMLVVGSPPALRVDGMVKPTDLPTLSPDDCKRLVFSMLNEEQIAQYRKHRELDISYLVSGMARFRVNIHQQRGSVAAAMRKIPLEIPAFTQLGLPKNIIEKLCRLRSGLILVTGQSGSGKTTTLASIIDFINSERPCHIITVEDPIEFVYQHKKAIVEQREVYNDSASFSSALHHILRQDPDIIFIGEMRDLETISSAITASETGQLVFATLHTIDASETINRIIDVFPWRQQQQIRTQLASTLKGVISQRLLPKAHGKGLVVASEVMLETPAIRNLIREGNTHQIQNVIETGAKHGMQSMDQALLDLYQRKLITKDEFLLNIKDKEREAVKSIL